MDGHRETGMPVRNGDRRGAAAWPCRGELDLPSRLVLDICRTAAAAGAAHPALVRLVWQTCGLAAVEPILAAVADIARLVAAEGRRPCFRKLSDPAPSGPELILLGMVGSAQRDDLAAAGLGAVTLVRGGAAAPIVANAMVLAASLPARGYRLAPRCPAPDPPRASVRGGLLS